MAAEGRRTDPAVIDRLFGEPHRFDFFQAVRVLDRYFRERADVKQRSPVGYDYAASQEIVRFRVLPALSFPAGSVAGMQRGKRETESPPEMTVTFMGMTGPNGVLPQHYTTLLLSRVREKDYALRDFLDLFNHRTISLFYRAWEKYRFPIAYERSKLESESRDDLFTWCLYCLAGLGTDHLRGRLTVDDESVLYYGGLFAHFPRAAISLECMLRDYFELPINVLQFEGQWLYLSPEDQSRMPSRAMPLGSNNRLGVNALVGERVWDVQSKIRIRLGPLSYAEFKRFMPTGDGLRPLSELTRSYIGPEFDFDVQPVLRAPEVPWCQLTADPADGPRLGWNTWVRCGTFKHDAEEPVFFLSDV